jgi:hypothetical protein
MQCRAYSTRDKSHKILVSIVERKKEFGAPLQRQYNRSFLYEPKFDETNVSEYYVCYANYYVLKLARRLRNSEASRRSRHKAR